MSQAFKVFIGIKPMLFCLKMVCPLEVFGRGTELLFIWLVFREQISGDAYHQRDTWTPQEIEDRDGFEAGTYGQVPRRRQDHLCSQGAREHSDNDRGVDKAGGGY